MHINYELIGKSVKGINKKAAGIFGLLIAFTIEHASNGHEAVREQVKQQEKLVTETLKVKLNENSTYKVAKNLLCNCVEAGIPLRDANGDPKGKTQLEDELAATKTPKSELEKFQSTMSTASSIADKLSDHECITAAALANNLLDSVAVRIKAAA